MTEPAAKDVPLMARLGAAGPLAIAWAVLPVLGSLVLFAHADEVRTFFDRQGSAGWLIFAGLFAVLSGFALLPTYAQSGMAGFIFKVTLGAPAAVLGCVGGSLIGYAIARWVSGDKVVAVIEANPKWRAIRDALVGTKITPWRLLGTVILLRLPPNSPFAMTNLAMAATRVPLGLYLLGTAIGIAPRTILAAYFGMGVEKAFSKDAWSAALPPWVFYGGIGLALIVVIIIGQIATKAVERLGTAPVDAPGV